MSYIPGKNFKLKVSGKPSEEENLKRLLWSQTFRLNTSAVENYIKKLREGKTVELYPTPEDRAGCEKAGNELERFGLNYEIIPK
jgi:hypothetical protein